MKRINANELARNIASREGKKISLSIAQIKEVQGLLLDELAWQALLLENASGVMDLLERRRVKPKSKVRKPNRGT